MVSYVLKSASLLLFIISSLTSGWNLWEGFTCLDVSQCLLNKAILDVAARYLEGDSFRGQGRFLTLGTKVILLMFLLWPTLASCFHVENHFVNK